MSLQAITYVVVGLTFALYIGIAIWSRAGSTKEFYVAGGGVHPVLNGMATGADWMSAASFISMAGLIGFMGYGGALFLMGWTGGYVLLAMLLAPYLRKFGKFTVPDFFKARFYSDAATIVAVICLLAASTTYIIGQMTGVGVAFSRFLGVSNTMGIFIGMAIVFMYAVFGGMKGITYTQVAQYCVLILAYTIPAIFISLHLTGNPIPQLGLGSDYVGSNMTLLAKLNQIVTELGFHQYTTQVPGSKLNMFVYTASLMLVPLVFHTLLSVSSQCQRLRMHVHPQAGRSCSSLSSIQQLLLLLLWQDLTSMPQSTQQLYPAEISSLLRQVSKLKHVLPWMKRWEVTGLLKFEDKNGDGRIQYYNDKSKDEAFLAKAKAAGWNGSELTVNRDIMVLANPEIARLPNWVIALVAAGGLAAALSTAAGLLLAISAAVSHDLLKNMLMKDLTDKGELMAGRIAMGLAILGAGYLGLNPPDFAAGTVAIAFGLAASSIFPALMMGIFSKTMNKQGAIAGMLAGLGITMFYVFAHTGIFYVKGTEFYHLFGGKNFFFGIHPNAFGAIGAVINFAVAFIVKSFTPPVPDNIAQMVEDVRVPRGAGAAAADH